MRSEAKELKAYAKPLLKTPFKVFRDEKHFTVGANLPAMIREALDSSEYLILLASPAAAKSPWVADELMYWCIDEKRIDRLIIILRRIFADIKAQLTAVKDVRSFTNTVTR